MPDPAVLLRSAALDGTVTDVLVDAGTVAAIGPDLPAPGGAQVVDLDGRVLLPGLWDAHVHFDQWTLARTAPRSRAGPLRGRGVALVAARLRTDPPEPGTVLVGHGFRDALWPDAPHRDLLDPVTGAVPVVLVAADLHCCWLNSAAAARYGMADHPTGLVRERDWMPIMIDVRSTVLDRWCAEAGRAAAARGVVGIVDYEAPWQLDAWTARIAGGADALRVVASVWPEALDGSDGPIARGLRSGDVVPGTGGLLTMGPLKVVTDGSLNTRTACCDDPYPGLTGAQARGVLLVAPDELLPLLRRAARHGIGAAVHAIGDRANALVLDTFAALATTAGVGDAAAPGRRIEHAQLLRDVDPARFAALGVVASVQPAHVLDDRDVADRLWAGTHRPRLPLPHVARRRRRDRSRLRRARGAARPVDHDRGRGAPQRRRPAVVASRAGDPAAGRARRVHGARRPGARGPPRRPVRHRPGPGRGARRDPAHHAGGRHAARRPLDPPRRDLTPGVPDGVSWCRPPRRSPPARRPRPSPGPHPGCRGSPRAAGHAASPR